MELFRVPLWDMVLIGSLNRNQWDPDADFIVTKGKTWLSDTGRRKSIRLFEERLDETWKHPVIGYSLSYVRTPGVGGSPSGEGMERRARSLRTDAAPLKAFVASCLEPPTISPGQVMRKKGIRLT